MEQGTQFHSGVPVKLVLVADDHKDTLDTLIVVLEMYKYRVVRACNGQEAVDVAIQNRPDIALLDIEMPVMDGFEAARRIRAEQSLLHTLIIAISGHVTPSHKATGRAAGMHAHLAKPVPTSTLLWFMGHAEGVPPSDPTHTWNIPYK